MPATGAGFVASPSPSCYEKQRSLDGSSVVGRQLFRQMVGIPMGTNCAPLLADLFLYSYENEFLDKLIKKGKRKLARKFNVSYRYIDDLISFNNKRFKEFISDIYPQVHF